jgi:hypothetical protein
MMIIRMKPIPFWSRLILDVAFHRKRLNKLEELNLLPTTNKKY